MTHQPADLPARLEAVLTERYTALGNPFSRMRRQEKGPDGWPAEYPVGPHHVAEALRELLADEQPAAAPVCICGHPNERHFEDVCQTCGCGDYLEPQDAAEVIARWRQAALKARADRAAVLTEPERKMLAFALEITQEEIHARSLDLADDDKAALVSLRRMADETATETPETPTVAWHILTHQRGTWRPWLAPRDTHTDAREDYNRCVSDNGHRWAFRLVRETSTFTVEAEHQPAAGARQDGAES